jgi:hypothetical protein
MVNAPAKTGTESNNKNAVTKIDQAYKGMSRGLNVLMCTKVAIKLIAPKSDERPAK